MKWISAIKEDHDVAGITQAEIAGTKTFRPKVLFREIGQRGERKRIETCRAYEKKRVHS